jgi:hypothetical protein
MEKTEASTFEFTKRLALPEGAALPKGLILPEKPARPNKRGGADSPEGTRITRMDMKPDRPPAPGLVADAVEITSRYRIPSPIHPKNIERFRQEREEQEFDEKLRDLSI